MYETLGPEKKYGVCPKCESTDTDKSSEMMTETMFSDDYYMEHFKCRECGAVWTESFIREGWRRALQSSPYVEDDDISYVLQMRYPKIMSIHERIEPVIEFIREGLHEDVKGNVAVCIGDFAYNNDRFVAV